jgi:hypothetical protein
MGLADWIQNKSGTLTINVALDVGSPIVDSGSLSIDHDGEAATGGLNMYLDTPFSKGFTKGRIRQIVRYDSGGVIPSTVLNTNCGIVCMQSQLDVSNITGSCYTWGMGSGDTTGSGQAGTILTKLTAGMNNTTGITELFKANVPGFAPSAGDFWTMELEWVADLAGLGGTRLIGRVGTKNSLDFGTLVDAVDFLDTTSPLLASVAEGVYMKKMDVTADTNDWTLDQTSVFELV